MANESERSDSAFDQLNSDADQVRLQQALRQSEERQRLILESARDYAIFTLDLERRVSSWNVGAEAMFGYAEDEIIGQAGDILFVPEDRDMGVPQAEARTAVQEGRAENERWHMRKNGSRFYGSGVTTPLQEQNGTIIGLVKVMRNLTAQKQAEEALKIADQRKDEFLAMLSHELQNPLAALHNTLLLLELTQGQDTSLSLPKAIRMMNQEIVQLQRMVDDLLDVSRISRGVIPLQWGRVELGTLINQAVEGIQALYESQNRQLLVNLPTEPVYVNGDATWLNQVLVKLLTNGVKYTREGGHVWITLELVAGVAPEALVHIRDDGVGLTSDQLTGIFEVFVQGNTSLDRPQGGLGLGLTVVKQLVEQHGGCVEAQSAGLGQGSEFIVRLPALSDQSSTLKHSTDKSEAVMHSFRLLVVDDNRDLADTTAMLIRRQGYETHTRYGGEEAIQAAEQLRPDVLLLDIGMPGLDGYAVCQQIRQQPWGKAIFIVALTGYGQQQDKQRSQQVGFNEHLVKPVDFKVLMNLLASIKGKWR
ncbi:hybrid sensor histidine kinase/response regulator [Spirosoma aerolatum]|uniref:hybrid sensor histidine kinase/response regulator n=1 Tax=Spirosoma aerolatum TaxID=1211326 RepID=UPI0009AE4099|nr:response regulator [Spirosoma aerolatum]